MMPDQSRHRAMMKRHNILTVLAVLLLTFAACDKNSAPGFSFTTDSILTLTFDKELDAAFVGVGTQNYNPVGMRRSGDTLFIANRAEGSDGVWVVRASTGELLYSLTGWTYNGKNEKFDNQVMDVAVSSDYIFVVNRSSRIDLFRRNDYSYVTTIGRTGWQSSSLLQCEAAEVAVINCSSVTNRRLKWCRFQIVRLKIVLRFLSLLRIRTVRLLITVLILSPSRGMKA